MLSLNLDMTNLFSQVNTWFNALWPIAVITIGIPFAFGLLSWIASQVTRGISGRR